MSRQFNRVAELVITLTEEILTIKDLRVDFTVYKSAESEPDIADIKIYNFNFNNRTRLRDQYQSLRLLVGYEGNIKQIFEGQILNVTTLRDNTNVVTQIFARDSAVSYDFGYTNRSYKKGFTLFGLFADLAIDLTRTLSINDVEDKTFQYGKTFSGATREVLDRLRPGNNFNWFLTPQTLHIVKQGVSIPDQVFVISPATGMINIPKVTERGVDVEMLLNPELLPARDIRIEANTIKATIGRAKREILPAAFLTGTGTFRILTITHTGSTYTNKWMSSVVTERDPTQATPVV